MENKKRIFSVLCIDGGGVRGIISARILQEIEEKTGKPIAELFDMVGGTSTGAIVASCLTVPDLEDPAKPRFSAKEVLGLYYALAPKVFPEIRFKSLRQLSNGCLYDPKPLEDGLKEHLGDARMNETLVSLLIPATDIKNFKPVWITHFKGQKDNSAEGWSSMLLRDAVRATTAAPTFFPAKYFETTPNPETPNVKHRHALIDGSFFGGNSMRHLMTQARKMAPPDAEIIITRIGTGNAENSLSPEEYNAMSPLGLVSKANGSILISLMINMSVMDVENDLKDEIGDRLFSFDGGIDPDANPDHPSASMDDSRIENLQRLEKLAEKIIKTRSSDIDRLCSILKSREFAEERHLESQTAMQKLSDMLAEEKTVKSLMRTYMKIVRFSTDMSDGVLAPEDAQTKTLAGKLSEHHKLELDRVYNVLLDKKLHQSKIINSIKEAGEDITKITKKIFVEPFKETPPPPADNDNKPPAPHINKTPKQGDHKPGI